MTTLSWQCPRCGESLEAPAAPCPKCSWRLARDAAGYWDTGSAPPGRFDPQRRDHLASIESTHFWFGARQALVRRLLGRILPPEASSGIELGCGTGRMLPDLSIRLSSLVGVDGWAESLAAAARSPGAGELLRADLEVPLPFARGSFDAAFAFDVLEHVDPDRFLAEARRLVRRRGRLLLSVPAFPVLFSAADARAGHRCRYRLAGLAQELDRNGWRLLGHAYYQCLLFPVLLASRKLAPDSVDHRERRPSPWIGTVLGAANRMEVAAGRFVKWPFGSSLFAWAEAA